jgi:hypothetical protein
LDLPEVSSEYRYAVEWPDEVPEVRPERERTSSQEGKIEKNQELGNVFWGH